MTPAQDHKAVYDGDTGPNTGGMGCYSPVPVFNNELYERSVEEVVKPSVLALKENNMDFRGVLYCGLILTQEGPKVLEYNTRFGDPETQVILPRLKSKLTDVLMATALRELSGEKIEWSEKVCLTLVAASAGYPGDYPTGLKISGLELAEKDKDVVVFHAGTAIKDGETVTAGGRVLNVTALADDFEEARSNAYSALDKIHFKGKYNRTDIGLRAIKQANKEEQRA